MDMSYNNNNINNNSRVWYSTVFSACRKGRTRKHLYSEIVGATLCTESTTFTRNFRLKI